MICEMLQDLTVFWYHLCKQQLLYNKSRFTEYEMSFLPMDLGISYLRSYFTKRVYIWQEAVLVQLTLKVHTCPVLVSRRDFIIAATPFKQTQY